MPDEFRVGWFERSFRACRAENPKKEADRVGTGRDTEIRCTKSVVPVDLCVRHESGGDVEVRLIRP